MKIKLNKDFNHKSLWLNSMLGMSMGFFSTLIVGALMGIVGIYSADNIFLDIKLIFTAITPFAIGTAIGMYEKLKPLEILALGLTSFIAARSLMITSFINGHIVLDDVKINLNLSLKNPGDVFSAWISSVLMLYFFSWLKINTLFDFLLLPLLGVAMGVFFALWLTYIISFITTILCFIIYHSSNKNYALAIVLAPVIGSLMGLALSLPTSSAAIAFALKLQGSAAIAAMAGTAAQMISFGVLTFWATKSISKTIAVSFGTSMLHMPNYSKKPLLLLIPTISSALCSLVATIIFTDKLTYSLVNNNGSVTTGMGTCVLYGPIFTLQENSWDNIYAWLNVLIIQLLLPLIITTIMIYIPKINKLIRKEDLQLWNITVLNTLKKQQK